MQVRLNFLSPLLSMSYQHLHNTLTASVLNVKLFTMPFHRDVQVTEQGAQAMLGALAYCQQVGAHCQRVASSSRTVCRLGASESTVPLSEKKPQQFCGVCLLLLASPE